MHGRLDVCKWVGALGSAFAVAIAGSGIAAATTFDNKAFSPPSIVAGGGSTMSLTLSNANSLPESVDFTDTFPAGLANGLGPVTWTAVGCGFPTFSRSNGPPATFGVNIVILGNSTCVITAPVTAASPGTYVNSSQSMSGLSINVVLSFFSAALQVQAGAPAAVPTVSEWVLLALGGGILLGTWHLRRRRARASGSTVGQTHDHNA